VFLSSANAELALRSIVETAAYQHWHALAVAVMTDHVHVTLDLATDADRAAATDAMRRIKAYASRTLNREAGRRPEWWTRGGARRALMSDRAVAAGVRYIAAQQGSLALLIDPQWRAFLEHAHGLRAAGSLGRESRRRTRTSAPFRAPMV
jgi:REP element-mobilizing transposase RayT